LRDFPVLDSNLLVTGGLVCFAVYEQLILFVDLLFTRFYEVSFLLRSVFVELSTVFTVEGFIVDRRPRIFTELLSKSRDRNKFLSILEEEGTLDRYNLRRFVVTKVDFESILNVSCVKDFLSLGLSILINSTE
jgi:hypothetical protein